MPIVDGLTSTKIIRSHEKSHPVQILSPRAALHSRIPIFAVSASLVETNLRTYTDAGFDGWILKPVDFKRLSVILTGIVEENTRKSCLYKPGEWEKGGWLVKTQPDVFAAATKPSPQAAVTSTAMESRLDCENDPFDDPISKEQERSRQLTSGAVQSESVPENPGTSGSLEHSGL